MSREPVLAAVVKVTVPLEGDATPTTEADMPRRRDSMSTEEDSSTGSDYEPIRDGDGWWR